MLRRLLFPFSLIWWAITTSRNFLFDRSILSSYHIPEKSITVGNLSVGGTGKTPMTVYLTKLLSEHHSVDILSRGHGRNTKGFLLLNEKHRAQEVGDEPLLYFRRFKKNVKVAVSENRELGIRALKKELAKSIIILDDAFQHRRVRAGFSVLLTTYNSLFTDDCLLPVGNLREGRSGAKRSDIIVVTKCPEHIPETQKNKLTESLAKYNKPIFFASISYAPPVPFGNCKNISTKVLVITGIAKPKSLIEFVSKTSQIEHISFPDHHNFSAREIQGIHEKIDTFVSKDWSIVTTEKDYVRLLPFIEKWGISNYPWFYIPIETTLENEQEFNQLILAYVSTI